MVDTFDPKRCWRSTTASRCPTPTPPTDARRRRHWRSPFAFQRYGKSVCPVSRPLRRTATRHAPTTCASSARPHADVPNHEPSLLLMNCGDGRLPRRSVVRGDLPAWAARTRICPASWSSAPAACPSSAPPTWRSAFLPGSLQGTHSDTQHADVTRLIENIRHTGGTAPSSRRRQPRPGPPAQREATGRARRRRPAGGAVSRCWSWPTACSSRRAEAFDVLA